MSMTTLDSSAELKTHIQALIELEPRFAPVYEQVGVPSLRRNEGGFAALLRAIVGQQLSVAAASSIWQRLVDANLITPKTLIQADDDDLRAQGLSKQKIRYVRSLVDHDIDYQALTTMSDGEVIATLTAVTGIGRWTAEMYLLFSLGRADILAVDDLAIRVAAMALLELPERPTPKQLKVATQSWSPYLSAASLLLWAYYGGLKDKEAMPV
ncbi:DNA-3-methyladenine glycosylase 2 family protein [uncultured Psychrobacter sp.]|jgi:DNA-3-methyladenine glycosylase II|uniref:DNA-3-methyladenine glycosylase family protein n=1 Tax=uncultured Psychrobacter sp. TaxID=259303 RepID=UPI00262E594B|nr:DNA-3-methyladenine glycosylase 2 family protein [uncultured Psychrobacter sp.]